MADPEQPCFEPQLRPMREDDLDQVIAVERQAYTHPWTIGIFRDCLRVGYSCWVWEDRGVLLGHAVMSVGAGEAHILNLSVRPASQGKGLGRRMLEHLLRVARRHGADTAFLEVRPSNKVAVGLYQSVGFSQVGVRYNYYPSDKGREDALIFALDLRYR